MALPRRRLTAHALALVPAYVPEARKQPGILFTAMLTRINRGSVASRGVAVMVVQRRQLRSPPLELGLQPLDALVQAPTVQNPDLDAHFKSAKNKIEAIDSENYSCKFTTIDGDALGDKIEKICHELKFEAAEDGGCVVKLSSEYHTKGDFELTDQHIEAAKAQASGLYKACEDYLIANPNVCV